MWFTVSTEGHPEWDLYIYVGVTNTQIDIPRICLFITDAICVAVLLVLLLLLRFIVLFLCSQYCLAQFCCFGASFSCGFLV